MMKLRDIVQFINDCSRSPRFAVPGLRWRRRLGDEDMAQ